MIIFDRIRIKNYWMIAKNWHNLAEEKKSRRKRKRPSLWCRNQLLLWNLTLLLLCKYTPRDSSIKSVSITTSPNLAGSIWTILPYYLIMIESFTLNFWNQFAEFTLLNALKKNVKQHRRWNEFGRPGLLTCFHPSIDFSVNLSYNHIQSTICKMRQSIQE